MTSPATWSGEPRTAGPSPPPGRRHRRAVATAVTGPVGQGAAACGAILEIARTPTSPAATSPVQTAAELLLRVARAAEGSRTKRIAIRSGPRPTWSPPTDLPVKRMLAR